MPRLHFILACMAGARMPVLGLSAVLLLAGTGAHATTITAYDALGASAQQALLDGAAEGFARQHAGDPAVAACIAAYRAPSAGGTPARLGPDVQALLDRSRVVAPDALSVEPLVEGLLMVECGILPD